MIIKKDGAIAAFALIALLFLGFLSSIQFQEQQTAQVQSQPFLQPELYPFPQKKSLDVGALHLDEILQNKIKDNPYTELSLLLFTSSYTVEEINATHFVSIQTKDTTNLLSASDRIATVLAGFYGPYTEEPINFSVYPNGMHHFFDTAPNIPEELKERVRRVLENAGMNRWELIRGVLALPKEEQELGWYFLAYLDGQGFQTRDGIFIDDARILDAQTVYENVHYTYLAWHYFPWAKNLRQEIVVAYLLPHRVGKEPLQPWRKHFFEALVPALENMTNPYEVGQLLINISQRIIVYNGNTFWEDQGPLTLLETHQGRSGEIAVFGTTLMRSVGIPSGELIMNWWPKEEGNHGFNFALIYENDTTRLIQFDQEWDKPIGNRTAKTTTYSPFADDIDVTPLVTDTTTFMLILQKQWTDVYLNVFMNGGWTPLLAAESNEDGTVFFDDIGNKRNYLFAVSYEPIAYFDDDPNLLAFPPFIVMKKSREIVSLKMLDPETLKNEHGTYLLSFSNLEQLKQYTLYVYSTEGFIPFKTFFTTIFGKRTLAIGMEGRLYILKDIHGTIPAAYERPFMITKEGIESY